MDTRALDFPPNGFRDDAVLLRRLTYADVPAIIAACRDPLIRRFNSSPQDESQARAWIDGAVEGRPSTRTFRLAIADPASDEFLGSLGVPELDLDRQRLEVGYWLAPSARGRGIGGRAVRLFCSWALDELGLARVEALPETDNEASQRLLERAGFTREGVLRSYELAHGTRRDVVMYSLLPGELRPGGTPSGRAIEHRA